MKKGKYNKIIFEEQEIQFIKDNFFKMTNDQIAEKLGCKNTQMRTFAYSIGLKRMNLQRWTPAQVDFLKNNFTTKGDKELAEIFENKWEKPKGWCRKHIEKKRRYLKFKRTPAQLLAIKQKAIDKGVYKAANIKRWENIGVTKIGEKRVWFKSNDLPLVVIKTNTGFVHYNRWLWQQHHGEIQKGMNVRIISDDKINFGIKDLQLITDAENMKLNSQNRVPPEFRETLNLIKKINKKITQITIAP